MAKLNTLWRSRAISNPLKERLIEALIWPIVTNGADTWTLNKELTGNIEAFEIQCYRRSMKVPYKEHVTNETILEREEEDYSPVSSITRITCKLKHLNYKLKHLRSHCAPQLTRQRHHAGTNARKKTPGRPEKTMGR